MLGLHVPTFWYENYAQDNSKTVPDAPNRSQNGPGNLEEAHETPPTCFQDAPKCIQGAQKFPDLDLHPCVYRTWRGGGDAALLRIGYIQIKKPKRTNHIGALPHMEHDVAHNLIRFKRT
jgi:hypothetical protein